MLRASSFLFAITYPNGRREQISVDSDSAKVGSGAHCEVRLPPEHAAVEHLSIETRQGAVFAEARTLSPPPTMNGLPFTHGRLLPESVVMVGQIGLSISLLQLSDEVEVKKRSTGRSSPHKYVLLAAIVLFGVVYFVNKYRRPDSSVEMPLGTPELWPQAEVNCPQQSKEPALAFAFDQRLRADTKRERSPFAPEDGVTAVPLYLRAAACFRMAGHPDEERESIADATSLRRRLSDDFHLNQLRLERALDTQQWELARHQIHRLQAYLGYRWDPALTKGASPNASAETVRGAYYAWLSNVDRRIGLNAAMTKKK